MNTALKFYKMTVLPTLLYESEAWTLTTYLKERIRAFYMKLLQLLAGSLLYGYQYHEKIDKKYWKYHQNYWYYRISWYEHVIRINLDWIPYRLLGYKLTGRQKTGMPEKNGGSISILELEQTNWPNLWSYWRLKDFLSQIFHIFRKKW